MPHPHRCPVRIAVDCMGGDHGPSVTLPACRAFLDKHPQAELLLVGTRRRAGAGARLAALHARSAPPRW